MSEELYRLAENGDLEEMVDLACEDGGEENGTMLRWLLVASSLPNDARNEAKDWSSDFMEFELKNEPEPIVNALFDVATWFLIGSNGVTKSSKHGFEHLRAAVEHEFHAWVAPESIAELREMLSEAELEDFDQILARE